MEFFTINFLGLERKLPLTYIASDKQMATFSIIGDVELTNTAGEALEQILHQKGINPDCFVCPGTNIINFCHHMAVRFKHKRYVALQKSICNYMTSPEVQLPWRNAPKHAKKLVMNGTDREYLNGKIVVLIDDVVSTGTTMDMFDQMVSKVGARVAAKCALFKQGNRYKKNDLMYLSTLPIFVVTRDGKKELLTEER